MPRFFSESTVPPGQNQIMLTGEDAHHIAHVLRMHPGEQIQMCDGSGTDLQCRIRHINGGQILLEVLSRSENQTEPDYFITLYQGLAKGDKMDQIIQKAVELGASRIVPLQCQRSVVRVQEHDRERKQQRWSRIAAEAAKQCGRGVVPDVRLVQPFSVCLPEAAAVNLAVIPWEMERDKSIRTVLLDYANSHACYPASADSSTRSFSVIIGPEGGLTEREISEAIRHGIKPVSLGRRILRTETAGPAVLAMFLYQFDAF